MRQLLALLLLTVSAGAAGAPPNIVLFLVDDMGWADPGFMGHTWHETPAMDRLAAEGTVFTQAYAPAPNCKPSRASLLTGQHPVRHGIYSAINDRITPEWVSPLKPVDTRLQLASRWTTLAEALAGAGYVSAAIGKWDLGDGPRTRPEAQGFDVALGGFRGGQLPKGYFAPFGLPDLDRSVAPGTHINDVLTDAAIDFIRAPREQPFFLFLSHYAVHVPLEAEADTVAHFRAKPRPDHTTNATYAAMLRRVDASLDRVLTTLEAAGVADNTVVVLASDNGPLAAVTTTGGLRGDKSTLWEAGLRVPLVIRWPNHRRSETIAAPVVLTDLFPTLLAAAGLDSGDYPNDGFALQGRRDGSPRPAPPVWHFPLYLPGHTDTDPDFTARPASALRDGPWKLLRFYEEPAPRLYHLDRDPGETIDLATRYPEKTRSLQNTLTGWLATRNAPRPEPNPAHADAGWWDRAAWSVQRRWRAWTTDLLVEQVREDTQ